jgi:hypothetical protein
LLSSFEHPAAAGLPNSIGDDLEMVPKHDEVVCCSQKIGQFVEAVMVGGVHW